MECRGRVLVVQATRGGYGEGRADLVQSTRATARSACPGLEHYSESAARTAEDALGFNRPEVSRASRGAPSTSTDPNICPDDNETILGSIISWKGRLESGTSDSRPIIQLDVMPTVLAAAGLRLESPLMIDGVNLLPYLRGNGAGRPHETLYWRLGGTMAIRKGDWKLVKMSDDGHQQDPEVLNDLSGAELYKLKDDIGETRNLAGARRQKITELVVDWQRWNKDLQKPRWPSR